MCVTLCTAAVTTVTCSSLKSDCYPCTSVWNASRLILCVHSICSLFPTICPLSSKTIDIMTDRPQTPLCRCVRVFACVRAYVCLCLCAGVLQLVCVCVQRDRIGKRDDKGEKFGKRDDKGGGRGRCLTRNSTPCCSSPSDAQFPLWSKSGHGAACHVVVIMKVMMV